MRKMLSMDFNVWGQTDVGLKREINQDSILVDKKIGLFIVADGMGGHKGGEVASAMAVETVREIVQNELSNGAPVSPRNLIKNAFKEASSRIYHKSTKENTDLAGMGTTMVCAFSYENRLYIGNVGDSRAYLFKEGHLWQITEDHSVINEQIRAGLIDPENAEALVGRNYITRSVGYEKDVNCDVVERDLVPGEIILMCSDGLCGLVSDEQIVSICTKNNISEVVPQCVNAAKVAGGDDNISVIVVQAK